MFLLSDEHQYLYSSHDQMFLTTARALRSYDPRAIVYSTTHAAMLQPRRADVPTETTAESAITPSPV